MRIRRVWSLVLVLVMPACLFGQSVSAAFGGSQLLGLAGVQTNYAYKDSFGWTGIGYYDGALQGSGYLNVPIRLAPPTKDNRDKYRLGIGDQELNTRLTTDEYEFCRANVRGASIFRHTSSSDIQAFVGWSSVDDSRPYFRAISRVNSSLAGAVIGHFNLGKTTELQSFNWLSDSFTSIQSLVWTPSRTWRISTAGGIGNNHPYVANAVEYRKGDLRLRTSYTFANDQFRRQDSSYGIEPLGFNGKAEIPLWRNTMARVSHRRELIIVPKYFEYKQNSSIGTVDTAGISTGFFGFRGSASVNRSSSNTYEGKNYSGVVSVSRKILPRWRSTFSYLHNVMRLQDIVVYQNTNEFRLNNHLSLSHNLSRINGSVSNTFGARWSSNPVSFSIDNQVYTSPIAAQFGQQSVFQAWSFSVRFRTPHRTSAQLETTIDPMGRTQWGGYLSGLQYHRLSSYSHDDTHVSFSKYVIRGKVVNEAGTGVWGIAIQVGPDLVYSDTKGEFFVHVKNAKPMPVQVVKEASVQSIPWTVQSVPTSAKGVMEAKQGEYLRIVLETGHARVASNKQIGE